MDSLVESWRGRGIRPLHDLYMAVIYSALLSRYGKDIIQPRIDALIKG